MDIELVLWIAAAVIIVVPAGVTYISALSWAGRALNFWSAFKRPPVFHIIPEIRRELQSLQENMLVKPKLKELAEALHGIYSEEAQLEQEVKDGGLEYKEAHKKLTKLLDRKEEAETAFRMAQNAAQEMGFSISNSYKAFLPSLS